MDDRFQHKKSLGQHFLNNPSVPHKMCDAANIHPGDLVVEVGPGTGMLTREILARGAHVLALEADERAIRALQETFKDECANGTLTIHHVDMRSFDLAELDLPDRGYSVVANIPYYLTGMLFRTFLEQRAQPHTIVFLTQKEVARRITSSLARGEKESLLSLSIKLYGTPRYVGSVPRSHFTPQPNVDSGIVAIESISRDRLAGLDPDHFFTILHLGFGKKRKQLMGNLAGVYSRDHLAAVFDELALPATVRAEDLPLDTWLTLAAKL